MKFLIDENLPQEIVRFFKKGKHQAFHINQIKADDLSRIPDSTLRKYSIYKGYVIVTKDFDFVDSYRSRKVPEKMIFVHHQDSKESLIDLFEKYHMQVIEVIDMEDFIELNPNGIRLPFN